MSEKLHPADVVFLYCVGTSKLLGKHNMGGETLLFILQNTIIIIIVTWVLWCLTILAFLYPYWPRQSSVNLLWIGIYICTVNVTWFCKRLLFEKCVSILFLFLCKILNDCNLQQQKQNKLYIIHNILITDWEGRAHQNCCEVHVAKAYWQSSTVIPKCLKDFFCGQSSGHIACTKSGRFYQKGNFGKYEPGRNILGLFSL